MSVFFMQITDRARNRKIVQFSEASRLQKSRTKVTRLRREVVNISQFPTVPNSGHIGGTTVPRDYDTGNKKMTGNLNGTLVANVCLFEFYNF